MKRITLIIIALLLSINPLIIFGAPADNNSNNIDISNSDANDKIIINVEENFKPTEPPYVTAQGAVLIEQSTGKVLFGRNEHNKLFPASTTKVLTALIAIEKGNLDDIVTVGEEVMMIPYDSSIAGLYVGEEITLRDLLFGLMINSGNDAAMTIAVHIARSIKGSELETKDALDYFAQLMNERAKEAGALNSNFVNPHGYHDPDHYTTAYDLAMITRQAMQYEFFAELSSAISMETKYWHTGEPRYWHNKNRLINKNYKEYYEYATGGKTGWTTPAGSCLISTATRDNMDLITVVLKSEHNMQWSDTVGLFEYGFHNYMPYKLFSKGSIYATVDVVNQAPNDPGELPLEITDDFYDIFHKSDLQNIKENITWNEDLLAQEGVSANGLPLLSAKIYKGQIAGEVTYTLNDNIIARSYLIATRDVPKKVMLNPGSDSLFEKASFDYGKYVLVVVSAFLSFKLIMLIVKGFNKRRSGYLFRR